MNPDQVIRLDLSNQRIDFSASLFKKFKNLEYLSLRGDHLNEIPLEITELKNLKVLDLSGNDFVTLPESFFKLRNLEELYLNEEVNMDLSQTID